MTPDSTIPPVRSPILPPSVLLLGAPGAGKTRSIATLLAAGLEVFVIVTESRGLDTLLDTVKLLHLPIEKLHWHIITPAAPGWTALADMAKKMSYLSYAGLSKLDSISKDKTQQLFTFLDLLNDFTCQRDGKSYGNTATWGDDRVLVIDSLSGMNDMTMALMIGYKPVAHEGEWGAAMNLQYQTLLTLNQEIKSFLVVLAHIDRESDATTNLSVITVSALGRKNAGKISRLFSEIILAKKVGADFFWSTADVGADLKNRALPLSDKLTPDFAPIIKAHRDRLALAKGEVATEFLLTYDER